jgi:hypothetical protein
LLCFALAKVIKKNKKTKGCQRRRRVKDKYPLLGAKLQDYLDFVKVAELIKSKEHLTIEGLAKIE